MDFRGLTAWAIQEGNVKSVAKNGVVFWQKTVKHGYIPALANDSLTYPMLLSNLFDIDNAEIIEGAYIESDGSISALANAVYTGAYTPVKPNTTYTWSGKDGGTSINYAICEYNANKEFLVRHSRHTSIDDDTWTTQADCAYLRFNIKKTDTRTTLMLEEGEEAHTYVPFGRWKFYKNYDANSFGYYDEPSQTFISKSGATGKPIVRVEYLESIGSQYIDTGVRVTSDDEVYLEACVSRTSSQFLLSQGLSADNQAYQIANTDANGLVWDVANAGSYRITTGISAYDVIRNIHIENKEIFVDGVSKGTSEGTLTTPTSTAKLLYYVTSSTAYAGKIAKFTVVDKCDLVSVRVGTTGYMMDLVAWKLYENAGTGAFAYGPDTEWPQPAPTFNGVPLLPSDTTTYPLYKHVNGAAVFAAQDEDGTNGYYNPKTGAFTAEAGMTGNKIEKVEYVTFNRTQMVDTGVAASNDVGVEIRLRRSAVVSDERVLGGTDASTKKYVFWLRGSKPAYDFGSSWSEMSSADNIEANVWHTHKFGVVGDYLKYSLDGEEQFSQVWSYTFSSSRNISIGGDNSYQSQTPSLGGDVSGVSLFNSIGELSVLIPVKVGSTYAFFDTVSWGIKTPFKGSLSGGSVTQDKIEFPTVSSGSAPYYPACSADENRYPLIKFVYGYPTFVAVDSQGVAGYYNPSTSVFEPDFRMRGAKIELIEYAESAGSAYINTGYALSNATANVSYSAKFKKLSGKSDDNCVFGVQGSSTPQIKLDLYNGNVEVALYAKDNNFTTYDENVDYEFEMSGDSTGFTCTLGDFSKDYSPDWTSLSSLVGKNIYLFARNNGGKAEWKCKGAIYWAKFIEDGVEHKFVPVKIADKACFMDLARWKIFYPIGGLLTSGEATGEELDFPDLEPKTYYAAYTSNSSYPLKRTVGGVDEYICASNYGESGYYAPSIDRFTEISGMSAVKMEQVEYVTFTGKQGVDTGVYGNKNTSFKINMRTTAEDIGNYALGAQPYNPLSQSNVFVFGISSANAPVMRILQYSNKDISTVVIPSNEWHEHSVYIDETVHYVIDETDIDTTVVPVDTRSAMTLAVGGVNCGYQGSFGGYESYLKADVKEFELYESGALVFTMVPIKFGSTYGWLNPLTWSVMYNMAKIPEPYSGGPVVGDIPWPEE